MYVTLFAAMLFVAATLAGLFAAPFQKEAATQKNVEPYFCCDTGDKEDCKPIKEDGFVYDGDRYNLLKSDGFLDYDGNLTSTREQHMDPARRPNGQNILDHKGRPVFRNRSEENGSEVYPECVGQGNDNRGYDRLYGEPDARNTRRGSSGKGCYAIPNELLIYSCRPDSKSDCFAETHNGQEVKFDIYIRQRDVDARGIPEAIKNCYKPPPPESSAKEILFRPSPEGQPNLQLRTFRFVQEEPPVNWMTPYCKPAIYLYPEKKTELNVSVFPKGKMLLTIPEYPKLGWDVVAEPNGDIYSAGKRFDYLYYEASIPDELVAVPDTGYVIAYEKREQFMRELVIKLGLNEKETNQFVEYWTPILPKSPYYFIGVVPVSNLDTISPVIITPKPKQLIRITVYFKPLNEKISVTEPTIVTPSRSGFTAVEWGGIVKRDKNHPFSCFM